MHAFVAAVMALLVQATPPGTYALGNLTLKPGMTLRVFHGTSTQETGRLKVIRLVDDEAQLELLSGEPELDVGDRIEVVPEPSEAHALR